MEHSASGGRHTWLGDSPADAPEGNWNRNVLEGEHGYSHHGLLDGTGRHGGPPSRQEDGVNEGAASVRTAKHAAERELPRRTP